MRRQLAVGIMILLAMGAACSPSEVPAEPTSPNEVKQVVELLHRRLPVPTGQFTRIAWLRGGQIVLETDPPAPSGFDSKLLMYDEHQRLTRLPLRDDPDCIGTGFSQPSALADGRLGFAKRCSIHVPHTLGDVRVTLEAMDLRTGELSALMSSPLGLTGTPTAGAMWGSESSWDPEVEKGIARIGVLGCETLVWLTHDGVEYATVEVEDPPFTWRLDDEFTGTGRGCLSNGRAMAPAWSPTGDTIAFFGSAHAPDIDVWDVIDDPWNLYLMDADELQPEIALSDLHPNVGLQWSPDGRFLAFMATIDGEHGLWVYSLEDDTVRGTLAEGIALAAWAPDGMQIASLMSRGEKFDAPAHVWIFDVSELVGGTE
jgi:WD40-like Beta Propeller Repeat